MEYVGYKVKLNVGNLLTETLTELEEKEGKRIRTFNENKRKLLPHVCTFLHYLAELHNSVEWCDSGVVCVRPNSVRGQFTRDIIDNVEEFIQDKTTDSHFGDNGRLYQFCSIGLIDEVKIWLNVDGKYNNTPNLEYSVSCNGYRTSIEEVIKMFAKKVSSRVNNCKTNNRYYKFLK